MPADTPPTHPPKPVVALLAASESTPSVLYGLYDVLLSVGAVYPDMVAGRPGESLLDVRIVAADARPFRCFGNVPIEPHAALRDLDRADAVVVCDLYTPIDVAPRGRYAAEIDWLRRMHAGGSLLTSVCSGSLLLAEAGLLDGRRAAGHWAYRDLFRSAYPRVHYCPEAILQTDAAQDRIVTAGGVTAWQELALYLIRRFCGAEHAVETAKVYLLAGHEHGQLPFADRARRIQTSDRLIADCQRWVEENFGTRHPVESMAARAGLATRTFARRFRTATGSLPMDYVHALRIEHAKRLIERDAGAIDDVAFQVGYEDPSFFRRLFKREVGLTPAAYRRKFASVLGVSA